jgi:diguanylate cyclase (GGDEF)-like protein
LLKLYAIVAFISTGVDMGNDKSSCESCDVLRAKLLEKDEEIQALRAKIDELGRHDSMTGALSRRTLTEFLETELQRAQRTGHPFCFAILDLDHFKTVNDRYGHPAGDHVLKAFAETALKLLRTVDRFGRMEGQEFGIVFPATWLDQGMIAMQRLRAAVAAYPWNEIAQGLALTFSAGLTTNAYGDTVEAMIHRAEQALAQAKQQGRNRTVQAEADLPDAPPIDAE